MSKVIGPRGILLYGESGVGKTYLGSIIATEVWIDNMISYIIDLFQLFISIYRLI